METLLTVDQVAEHLLVKPATVRTWIRLGKLRAVQPGGHKSGYRIKVSDLEAFVDGRPARPEDAAAS